MQQRPLANEDHAVMLFCNSSFNYLVTGLARMRSMSSLMILSLVVLFNLLVIHNCDCLPTHYVFFWGGGGSGEKVLSPQYFIGGRPQGIDNSD